MKTHTETIKYKIVLDLIGIQSYTNLKGTLLTQDKHFILKIPNCSKIQSPANINMIDSIYATIKPLYMINEDSFSINYGLIKTCRQNEKQLKLEIFNPAYLKCISIIITHIESVGILLNKTLSSREVSKLVTHFTQKSILCSGKLMI